MAPTLPTTVGVIGVGTVGTAVVEGLVCNGYAVIVHDKSTAAAAALLALPGVEWAGNPVELAAAVPVLLTALPAPRHVRAAMEGEGEPHGGALAALAPGALWIDHTSTDPTEPPRLGAAAAARGVRYLEAPLTGGVTLLKAGKMTVYMGGEPDVAEEALPVLRCYTATQMQMGAHGTAAVTKIVSNMLCAAHTVVTGEALMMAKRSGVDLRSFFDAIRASAGNSYVFETEAPLVFNQTFDPDFTLALHTK
jgi:3-hydroxyisobutyrate dehydrogenase